MSPGRGRSFSPRGGASLSLSRGARPHHINENAQPTNRAIGLSLPPLSPLPVFFSVFSWAIIFFKHKTLKSASRQSDRFLEAFRRSKSLTEVNESAKRLRASPLAVILLPGHKELA